MGCSCPLARVGEGDLERFTSSDSSNFEACLPNPTSAGPFIYSLFAVLPSHFFLGRGDGWASSD